MSGNAHATTTLQMLQAADEQGVEDARERIEELTAEHDTYECPDCGNLWLDPHDALDCCTDTTHDDDPDAPAIRCDGGSELDDYLVPSVEDLDRERERLNLSRSEFSRMAGREVGAWSEIVTNDIDPQLSTIETFLTALREADPNGDRPQPGRKPRLRSDGGTNGGDAA